MDVYLGRCRARLSLVRPRRYRRQHLMGQLHEYCGEDCGMFWNWDLFDKQGASTGLWVPYQILGKPLDQWVVSLSPCKFVRFRTPFHVYVDCNGKITLFSGFLFISLSISLFSKFSNELYLKWHLLPF